MNKLQFAIDPAVISPHYFPSNEAFDEYVQLISSASNIAEPLIIDQRLIEFLLTASLFPLRPSLENLIARHGADYIDADSIARILNRIIADSISFDEEILYERNYFRVNFSPNCNCHPDLDVYLINLLEYLCILNILKSQKISIFGLPRTDSKKFHTEYCFSTVISGDAIVASVEPGILEFTPIKSIGQESEYLSFREQWAEVDYDEETFRVLLQGFLKNRGVTLSKLESLKIGSDFCKNMQKNEIISSDKLFTKILESVFEVVSGEQMQKSHALRNSSGGGSKAIIIEGYAALRHDINYDFHLHYWKGPDRKIELANVDHHNNFNISNRSAG